jgi:Zn-finger nucleic acid-binding protein
MRRTRRCIKCTGHPTMAPTLVNEVAVDLCPSSQGLWLDRDELARLSGSPDELAALEEMVRARGEEEEPRATQSDCPACARRLCVASVGSFHVEYCTACGGVFLDRGELEKVLSITESKNIVTIVALASSMVASGSLGG